MKNKKTNIITFSVLLIAVIFSVIFAVGAMDGGSTEYWKLVPMEIADYRKDTGYEAPDYDDTGDWLFAGWFDEEGNAVSTDTKSGTYNAKFVPADILGVQAQVNYELYDGDTTNDDTKIYTIDGKEEEKGAGAIRFVTSVDTLDYSKIGFKITRGTGAEEDRANNKVYQRLYATKELGNASSKTDEFKPKELFNKDASTYFKTWTYTKVPSSVYDMDITVTPYWVTLDGTTVKGTTSVKCVNMGRQWKYIFVDDTGSDDVGTGTRGCPYKTLNGALAHIKKYGKSTGGEVWVLDSFTAASDFKWADHDLDVTITGDKSAAVKSKIVDFSLVKDMGINDAVIFDNMILKFHGTSSAMGRVHANGNRFEIAADVTSNNRYTTIHGGAFNGDVTETNVTILAGRYRAVYGGGCVGNVEKDTHVTLKNTDVYNTETSNDSRVHGGSNRGTVGGNTYITIGEGFNKGLGSNYKEHHHYSSVYGGSFSGYSSTIGTVKGNTYVVIEDDAKVNFIYGGGYNYSNVEGTCHVEFKGGNALSVYGGSGSVSGTNSHTSVVMTGGEVEQVIGGCYATDMTSNANVQILGGTVTRRIFGGCYNDYEIFEGWQSSKSVIGKTNVTIGSGATLAIVSDDDNSICSVSRYKENFDTETGIMVLNAGQTENMLGFDMSGLSHELYTNYLVSVDEGGSALAENGVLYIAPDTNTPYSTVTYVTNDNKVLCCTQGEGVYKLPELTDRTKIQEIKVTFSKNEPDVSGFVAKNIVGENATYYNSLDEALEVADKNTKVVVLKDIVVSNPITFTKDITLTSETAVTITRDVSLADNMFTVEAGTFSIVGQKNAMITIEGNSSEEGSVAARAIRVENGATCNTEYAVIQNFSIASSGAAISCDGTLYSSNSTYKQNSATNGSGGAIYATNGSNIIAEKCDYIQNTCTATGGALYVEANANATVKSVSFVNNTSTGNGGAVYCKGTYLDESSGYVGNTGAKGGAIIVMSGGNATLTGDLSNTKFSGNTATASQGTAIFVQGTVDIDGYAFEGENTQTIYVTTGTLIFDNITGATIVQGSATGGILKVAGSNNVDKVTITPYKYEVNRNMLTAADGLEDSVFKSACKDINVTPNGDKAWYINTKGKLMYGEARIGDTYYATLSAAVSAANTNGGTGGAEDILIHVYKDVEISSKITISKNMVIQNELGETVSIKYASNSTTYELIQVVKDAKLTLGTNDVNELGKLIIDGTRTLGKTNDKRMIAIDSSAKFILCKNATIQNANNNQWGCALINKGTSELYGDVKNNTCTGAGGAILQHAGSLIIKDGEYSGNNATSSSNGLGGVIRVYGGTLEIQGGNFTNNSTKYLGGVLYSVAGTTVTVTGGTFSNNTASEGSAFYCLGTLNCTDAIFEGNVEQTIYAGADCTFSNVTGATFIQGTAEPIKVAGYTDTNVLKIIPYQYATNTSVLTKADGVEDSVFEAACAGITVTLDSYGNQWYIDANGCLNINAEVKIGNVYYETLNDAVAYANENGGTGEEDDITINVLKDVEVSETLNIEKNIALVSEKAITFTRTESLIDNMFNVTAGILNIVATADKKITLDGNSTGVTAIASAINVSTGAEVNMEYVTIQNFCAKQGAAIYSSGKVVNVNCTFSGNVTTGEGGAIYANASSDITVTQCEFNGNKGATGGVIYILKGGKVTSDNSSFTLNKSYNPKNEATNGGVIACYGEYIDINSTFTSNEGKNGGALIIQNGGVANLTGTDASFSGNSATTNGSAIFVNNGAELTITGYLFAEEQNIYVGGTASVEYSGISKDVFTGTGTPTEMEQTEE